MCADALKALRIIAPFPLPDAVFLCTTSFHDVHIFSSVSATGNYASGKRVIVTYQRDGRWHCESCRYLESCKHKPHAVKLAAVVDIIVEAHDNAAVQDWEDADVEGKLLLTAGGRDDHKHGCVSHMRVLPPRWCALPTENIPVSPVPSLSLQHFHLDALARCVCGTAIHAVSGWEAQTPVARQAALYGLTARVDVLVDLIPCPVCRHRRRYIGPDLGALGILNLNNEHLFAHQLLNHYTSTFTASETPFSAYCLTLRRQYLDQCPLLLF